MPFKPNYAQQRGDRKRAKEAKQQEKLERRKAAAAERKGPDSETDEAAPDAAEPPKEA
jgi:hypothetical protein